MFTRGSRYEGVAQSALQGPDGRTIPYKRIRFLPEPGGQGLVRVEEGDRPDLLAWRVAQDPEGWWRLCDAAGVMRPSDLVAVPGRLVPLPRRDGR